MQQLPTWININDYYKIQKSKRLGLLTQVLLVGINFVVFNGARQAEQLDQPALVSHERGDVATGQNLCREEYQ